jgi:hypothetical protein
MHTTYVPSATYKLFQVLIGVVVVSVSRVSVSLHSLLLLFIIFFVLMYTDSMIYSLFNVEQNHNHNHNDGHSDYPTLPYPLLPYPNDD